MVCLQQPANLVPHVVQAGVSYTAGGDDLIAVQPRVILCNTSRLSSQAFAPNLTHRRRAPEGATFASEVRAGVHGGSGQACGCCDSDQQAQGQQ